MQAIATTNLTKKYGPYTAVRNLNLTVESGELFALLGMNGAGKTTAIKMLSCLMRPTSGDAILLGDSIKERAREVRQKINISPQETAVAPKLSVLENLMLMAGIYGQGRDASRQSALQIASRFGLEGALSQRAKTLSGGMQRRLSIAMALITSPSILFLDEPTLGLDVLARRELWASIKALKGKVTMLLTSHYLDEVEALADRIGVMAGGTLIAVGTPRELARRTGTATLEDAFVALAGGAV